MYICRNIVFFLFIHKRHSSNFTTRVTVDATMGNVADDAMV